MTLAPWHRYRLSLGMIFAKYLYQNFNIFSAKSDYPPSTRMRQKDLQAHLAFFWNI